MSIDLRRNASVPPSFDNLTSSGDQYTMVPTNEVHEMVSVLKYLGPDRFPNLCYLPIPPDDLALNKFRY